MRHGQQPIAAPALTAREGQILELLGAGRSNRDIANVLHVTVKDVEYHVGNLLRKLESRNRTEAVSRAYVFGYLSVGKWPPVIVRTGDEVDPEQNRRGVEPQAPAERD